MIRRVLRAIDDLSRVAGPDPDGGLAICPHCWMVNPGPGSLCGRCGADMRTFLQESGGLRRTAPVQSPLPIFARARLSLLQKATVTLFVSIMISGYLLNLVSCELPTPRSEQEGVQP